MVDELLDTCEHLVKLGSRAGADEIEVFASQQRSTEIGLENNEMKIIGVPRNPDGVTSR